MFAKWHTVNGIKCQGNIEKSVAENLFNNSIDFKRGSAIKTPFGNYTPDFDCGDYFIEVKSLHSWLQALGKTSLLENAKKEEFSKKSNNSQLKMEWVDANTKSIIVFVEITRISSKFKDIIEPLSTLKVVRGHPIDLISFLKNVK